MPAEQAAQTPNILVLMVDQMRADALSCAGHPVIRTPALDRLAAEGTRFANAYTPVPVCIAARHSFMTGQRCARHGRHGNNVPNPEPQLPTVMELLGLAGYTTRGIGKMHFRPVRRHFGFHRMELMEEIPDHREDDEYLLYLKAHGYGHKREVHGVRNLLYHLPQVSAIPEERHGSTWVADRTIEFLKAHRRRPFFCWSSWIAPHPPWNPPEPWASKYPFETIPPPFNYDRPRESMTPQRRYMRDYASMGNSSPERLKRVKALYYGSISLIDHGVGRILRALDALGLAERTLVAFVSDHGEMLGDHGQWQKSIPYEGSTRIPFLARLPGRIEAGAVREEFVSLLDLAPTFLDLARVPYPGTPALPGASLLGRPGGGLAEPRSEIVLEIGHEAGRWLSLRRGNWKYNYYLRDGWEELYDLAADPREAANLLLGEARPAERRRADEMKAALEAWERKHGFADSLDAAGRLKNYNLPEPQPARANSQFPRWVDKLPPEELAQMESKGETVLNAIRHETTFTLRDIDLESFKQAGGSLEGTEYEGLIEGQ
ncbi:MAG: sulfatase-like hydrolase/transferase [Planctomycetota bacterium]|nr:sulfatase-like hydrolase/transferase [Planctomycetota bacterium]